MKLGFFPCAPLRPTLAVNINLLQFVSFGFLNMAPNVTGWAKTIEEFLRVRGYAFSGAVSAPIFLTWGDMTDSHAECIPKTIRQCATMVPGSGTADET